MVFGYRELLSSNFRGERHGRHKEKFYYRGTCWSPFDGAARSSPFRPTLSLTTSAGSSPASIKPRAHSNGHNVIEPFPPAWALHFRRREEEITAGYLLVTTVTNAVVQATIPHRHRITFKSHFRPRCRRVIDSANERKNLARDEGGASDSDDRLIVYQRSKSAPSATPSISILRWSCIADFMAFIPGASFVINLARQKKKNLYHPEFVQLMSALRILHIKWINCRVHHHLSDLTSHRKPHTLTIQDRSIDKCL